MPTGVDLEMKRGDTEPQFRAQCRGKVYDVNGNQLGTPGPDGLTGVSLVSAVSARLLIKGNNGIYLAVPVTIEPQVGNDGWVHRAWAPTDTEVAGFYRGEVEVTWPGGRVQTFPSGGGFTMLIREDLG